MYVFKQIAMEKEIGKITQVWCDMNPKQISVKNAANKDYLILSNNNYIQYNYYWSIDNLTEGKNT